MTPAISVRDLVKIYHRRGELPVRAVDGLSFDVASGSIFGLLGPNGAGKTTTLRILTTLAAPTSGQAIVLGYDVVREPAAVRRHISVVVQESAAELFLTVRDNLLTFARFHGLSGRPAVNRAGAVMEYFGLTAESDRKVFDLSGGYRRRVQVAKVFMVDTPVVFLDEFSTGMDPILKRSIMARLREEAERGRTIVLTTQVLTEAEELCDDILIINHGREAARGDLQALRRLTEGVYEVSLAYERLPEGVRELLEARGPLRLEISAGAIEVALKEDERSVLALLTELAGRGRLIYVQIGGATLEDIFIELTAERADGGADGVRPSRPVA